MIENTLMFAEWLHNSYESISEQENWNTQKICQVNFNDLPPRNKRVMIKMAERIKIQFQMFFDKIIDDELNDMITSNIIETELLKLKEDIKNKLRGKLNQNEGGK